MKTYWELHLEYHGATRGSFLLERLDTNKFKILGVNFNTDVCFDVMPCYDVRLRDDIDVYIGRVLDFRNVELRNNYVEFTY